MPGKKRDPAEDQARVDERRRQILDAAATVFRRQGYARARTRDIAAEAGLSEGSLYNYYASKREIMLALAQRVIDDTTPGLLAHLGDGDPEAWLTGVLADRVALLERNLPTLGAVLPELLVDEELRELFLDRIARPLVAFLGPYFQRRLPPGRARNPRVLLPALIGGLLFAYVANEHLDMPLGERADHAQLIEQLAEFYLHGLGSTAAVSPEEVHK
jgi:AcrR family transcriptional regulator